jgi:hypothetical protein
MSIAHRKTPNAFLTRREAAAYLGISESLLKSLDLKGRGPAAFRLSRRWLYTRHDLDAFLQRHYQDPAASLREVAR